jgi:hypothetical protein
MGVKTYRMVVGMPSNKLSLFFFSIAWYGVSWQLTRIYSSTQSSFHSGYKSWYQGWVIWALWNYVRLTWDRMASNFHLPFNSSSQLLPVMTLKSTRLLIWKYYFKSYMQGTSGYYYQYFTQLRFWKKMVIWTNLDFYSSIRRVFSSIYLLLFFGGKCINTPQTVLVLLESGSVNIVSRTYAFSCFSLLVLMFQVSDSCTRCF